MQPCFVHAHVHASTGLSNLHSLQELTNAGVELKISSVQLAFLSNLSETHSELHP